MYLHDCVAVKTTKFICQINEIRNKIAKQQKSLKNPLKALK